MIKKKEQQEDVRLEPILCRRWKQLLAAKFNQNPELWHVNLVYDSRFGTIKLPKVQIGT